MASSRKRARGAISSSSKVIITFGHEQPGEKFFHDVTAEKTYTDWVNANKRMLCEVTFAPSDEDGDGILLRMIAQRGWKRLAQANNTANISVVREFYANARQNHDNCQVNVRGVKVSFSESAIRAFYKLPKVRDDAYFAMKDNPDHQKIISELCALGTRWVLSTVDNVTPRHLLANSLSKHGKAWNMFVCKNLLPSTQRTQIPVKRAVLIYCICAGLPIDAAKIIKAAILKCVGGSTTGGLGHACLITALCDKAGVQMGKHESTLQPGNLNSDNIVRYSKRSSSAPTPLGVEVVATEGSVILALPPLPLPRVRQSGCKNDKVGKGMSQRARQRATARAPASKNTTRPRFTIDDIGTMMLQQNSQLAAMNKQLSYLQAAVDDMHIRHAHMASYMNEYAHAMAVHYGHQSRSNPAFPPFPAYLIHPYRPTPDQATGANKGEEDIADEGGLDMDALATSMLLTLGQV